MLPDGLPTLDPAAGVALLLTDIVDSTEVTARLGEARAAALWAEHDRAARGLLPGWRGREIDKSDGFLMLFATVPDALGYAEAYHAALALLEPPLVARAGIHFGPVQLRENPPADVARGAKPLEVDGLVKSLAARIMAAARGRQTLLSEPARAALAASLGPQVVSHGHWRFKGVDGVFELFEAARAGAVAESPPGGHKAWRVVRHGDLWQPVQAVPHSLPAERDRFIGRAADLAELRRRFRSGVRLVSLLGTGGTGKTRLAVRFGWESLGDHPDGVWFCDLSAARSAEGIVHAVAQGLQLALAGGDPVRQIGDAIAGRPGSLVILDNFEQVAGHAQATLGAWLDRAPQAVFCVTTRELLGVVGEQALGVDPLPPDDGVTLLRERAAAAGSAAFDRADEAALPVLVRLLDGLPLAIELAASRMPVLPPARLLPRMDERFRLLASARGRTDRHATLRATLDWSWELLSEAERLALAQLSVFEGGFTLEAAEAVLDLSACPGAPWTLDVVQALVQKSLVRAVGEGRFDLLRAVQAFAAERHRLRPAQGMRKPDEPADVELRHAKYFGALDERAACAQRCVEADNLVAATRRMVRRAQPGAAGAALLAAWAPLRLIGPFTVAVQLAGEVLALADLGHLHRSAAHWVRGSALVLLGEIESARTDLELAMALAAPDTVTRWHACCALGELESDQGHVNRARDLLHEALAGAERAHDVPLQCRVMNALGGLALEHGPLDSAVTAYRQALDLARRAGDRRWEGGVLGNLGVVCCNQGDLNAGRERFEQALACARDSGDRRFEGNTQCNLGLLLLEMGHRDDARRHLEASLAAARAMGHARLEATVHSNLGLLAEYEGRHAGAVAHHHEAVAASIRQSDPRSEYRFRAYLGRALARAGRCGEARTCLQRARDLEALVPEDTMRALLSCAAAEVEWLDGEPESARRAFQAACALAPRPGAGESGELTRELERCESLLATPLSPC